MKKQFIVASILFASLLASCSSSSFKDDIKMFRNDYSGKWVETYCESKTSSKKISCMAVSVSNLGEKAYSFYPSEFSVNDNGTSYTCISFLKSKEFSSDPYTGKVEGYITETINEASLEPNTGYALNIELCFDATLSENASLTYVNKDTKESISF